MSICTQLDVYNWSDCFGYSYVYKILKYAKSDFIVFGGSMRLYWIAWCLIITVFCSPYQALSDNKLYVGYEYCQSPPFVIFKYHVLVGDIIQ